MEPKPAARGTYYGEKSPQGEWWWAGTGLAGDDWASSASTQQGPSTTDAPSLMAYPTSPPFPSLVAPALPFPTAGFMNKNQANNLVGTESVVYYSTYGNKLYAASISSKTATQLVINAGSRGSFTFDLTGEGQAIIPVAQTLP